MARKHGWKIGVASFEQPTRPDHEEWLIHWYWERPPDEININERQEAVDWIDEQFVFIEPPGQDLNTTYDLMWLEERMAAAVLRYGVQMIVVDPWNEIEHNKKRTESLTEYVGDAIRSLKRFAAKYNVHLMVVAHPMKPYPNKDGTFPAPTLYSISDSAHWYNKPDVGIIVLRDPDNNTTTIRVAKSRYQDQIGRPGDAHCWYNWRTHRFEEI
jgi:twinkle protein